MTDRITLTPESMLGEIYNHVAIAEKELKLGKRPSTARLFAEDAEAFITTIRWFAPDAYSDELIDLSIRASRVIRYADSALREAA